MLSERSSALYLKLWKRYFAGIRQRWDLGEDQHPSNFEKEEARYLKRDVVKAFRRIQRNPAPKAPFWRTKFPSRLFSYASVLLMCAPGGCMFELTKQLVIIMLGQKMINLSKFVFFYQIVPPIMKFWRPIEADVTDEKKRPWWEDYALSSFTPAVLRNLNVAMILQFSFCTIFVTAVPLAPLIFFISNLIDIRLEAKKFLTHYKRPVYQTVEDIGVLGDMMDLIGKVSIRTNAFIIAFTCEFIPKWVYFYHHSDNSTMNGYFNKTLSWFDTRDFMDDKPDKPGFEYCRFTTKNGFIETVNLVEPEPKNGWSWQTLKETGSKKEVTTQSLENIKPKNNDKYILRFGKSL
ncbi:anoctamin-2-like isoform X2 [Artemia franciscana]|uniref:anoctamin-2-like isoform X2 n=1 Tax=Artemia franciscana TaxID=6661 RepID=UPI0032DA4112